MLEKAMQMAEFLRHQRAWTYQENTTEGHGDDFAETQNGRLAITVAALQQRFDVSSEVAAFGLYLFCAGCDAGSHA